MHVLEKNRRVPYSRLKLFLEGIVNLIKSLALEYIDIHTNKEAQELELKKIVSEWFLDISKGAPSVKISEFGHQLDQILKWVTQHD